MSRQEQYMHRCIQLALKGAGKVSPNPMVGAVLVYQDRIIGEGWHQRYGASHAEVNCIASVTEADKKLIPYSTLYVSLEPCAHFGKTPPCADLIVASNIPEVIIGCTDTFSKVSGKGIEKLLNAGIRVTSGILEKECRWLNRRFFTFHEKRRPYIILKWAESQDRFIAPINGNKVMLSGKTAQVMVHKIRAEEDGIMVGYKTALLDNPQLNTRHWPGKNPVRIVWDPDNNLPQDLYVFDQAQPSIIFNNRKNEQQGNVSYISIDNPENAIVASMDHMHKKNLLSVIIEGGAHILQRFINAGLWDEAYVISTPVLLGNGIPSPRLSTAKKITDFSLEKDQVNFYIHE